jgi:hypothetical protein
MQSNLQGRVIGRKANVVLIDFSRKPDPPAPRFPGAGGLREMNSDDCHDSYRPIAA